MMTIEICREIGLWIMGKKDIKPTTFFEWKLIQSYLIKNTFRPISTSEISLDKKTSVCLRTFIGCNLNVMDYFEEQTLQLMK